LAVTRCSAEKVRLHIDLSGRIAIVSGSTAGIGLAAAKGLAQASAAVVINVRTQETVGQAVEAIGIAIPGAKVAGFTADLSTPRGCDSLAAEHKSCDILVNNIGIYGEQDFFEVPDREWTRFFEANVMSGVRLSRAYLPAMIERG
jgi:NAD(P)-dependent dehydrogenase (short-subunit alcohol dehydrogenase family)